ncbi:hypothetical protein SLEP1_g54214 [Rubroshorea leprosula]|uniref:Uncharacterized protein n=1 Tax=Rubroshorea leprosula TaxID=152421 RepID=A0AAV5MFC3_9ROSI|nr:hypothetical protein SLEP1_g54214 [Rubroshorea leprosula]
MGLSLRPTELIDDGPSIIKDPDFYFNLQKAFILEPKKRFFAYPQLTDHKSSVFLSNQKLPTFL